MRSTSFAVPVVALSLFAFAATSCSKKQVVHTQTELAKALVSDEQEEAIGLQLKNELNKQGVRLLDDPDVQAYVDGIGRKVFSLAEKDRKGVKWHVHVVADDKLVNAFATPGGHIYITTGLLAAADDESEVAGVLAHEAGHISGRHSARMLVEMFGLQTIGALALGKNPGLLASLAANVTANGLLLANSRDAEHEADTYGVKYASKAGYDPRGIVRFFKKLKAKQGKTPQLLVWLSTHPATNDRIEHVERLIHERKLTGGTRNEMRHAAVKQILADPQRRNVRGTEPVH
jgi:beta-barrel assembly-enhancing protease